MGQIWNYYEVGKFKRHYVRVHGSGRLLPRNHRYLQKLVSRQGYVAYDKPSCPLPTHTENNNQDVPHHTVTLTPTSTFPGGAPSTTPQPTSSTQTLLDGPLRRSVRNRRSPTRYGDEYVYSGVTGMNR